MSSLVGKIAVLTGATQGLGAAIARVFAEADVEGLIVVGRNAARGQRVCDLIADEFGTQCHFVGADLADLDAVRGIIPAAKAQFGRVDILVNAAGMTDRGNLLNTNAALFDKMIAVNTRAPFFLMQDAVLLMQEAGVKGSIVNIGSASSRVGQPFLAPYAVSKGALATLSRHAGFALMRNRVRVNQLDIGWMNSDGERALQEAETGDPGALDRAAKELPFGRLLDPVEVAKAVLWMASDDSGMMTGSVIHFDQSVWGGYDGQAPAPAHALVP
ncbi:MULTISPECIES: SDR family oxidoreductase [unclassified Roseobacter]|uniref:SDR family oxidoreductase n=1 Tax=unclassified Roseobacter TaxID=196798 RepID=UPI001D52DE2B|nr:SDR family oxidoreductase [Rhodobacterales bacterium HKCCD6035]